MEVQIMVSLLASFVNNVVLPLRGTKYQMSSSKRFAKCFDGTPIKSAKPTLRARLQLDVSTEHGGLLTIARPKKNASNRSILYLHGGSYVNELVAPHWDLICGLISRTGATVWIPRYPLAPRYTWRDAFKVLGPIYAQVRAASQGGLTIAGDSAGAGLSLAFTQHLRDQGISLPDKLLLISPWLDVSMSHPETENFARRDKMLGLPGLAWAGKKWAGGLSVEDPRVSPLYGSLVDLPPMAVFAGSADLLYMDAIRLKQRAGKIGARLQFHDYPGMFHVWMAAPLRESFQALDEAAAFLLSEDVCHDIDQT